MLTNSRLVDRGRCRVFSLFDNLIRKSTILPCPIELVQVLAGSDFYEMTVSLVERALLGTELETPKQIGLEFKS